MNAVAACTGLEPPHMHIAPHLTFHPPLASVGESTSHTSLEWKLRGFLRNTALRNRRTHTTVDGLFPFGKEYIVMPAQTPLALAALWVTLMKKVVSFPEYVPGRFDRDNILHITIAEKTSAVFDKALPCIEKIVVPTLTIPIESIELIKKRTSRWMMWEQIEIFPLSR